MFSIVGHLCPSPRVFCPKFKTSLAAATAQASPSSLALSSTAPRLSAMTSPSCSNHWALYSPPHPKLGTTLLPTGPPPNVRSLEKPDKVDFRASRVFSDDSFSSPLSFFYCLNTVFKSKQSSCSCLQLLVL